MSTSTPDAVAAPEPGSASPDALPPGTLVADRYRVVGVLGRGGMGVVYRAEHVLMRKAFALKVLYGEALRHPEAVARFEREAVTAAKIVHPNVVAATDFGKLPDGAFFLVLELVEGRSLRSELAAGALEPARATRILRGVLAAVAAAHASGIVHRDLKPENIMLVRRDDDDDFVKVLDFGIAKLSGGDATPREGSAQFLTQVGAVMGTPDYMSPEQGLGQPVDARSDLYSLGVVFFELLTGACPFRGSAVEVLRQHILEPPPPLPQAVVAALGPGVAEAVTRLLAKEPSARFQTAPDLAAALDEATAQAFAAASLAEAEPAASQLGATTRRRALVGAGVGAIIVLGVLAASGALSGSAREAAPAALTSPAAIASSASEPPTVASAAADPALTTPAAAGQGQGSAGGAASQPAAAEAAPSGRARTTRPAPRPAAARKTGPGGIYVPPPSEWFK